MSHSKMKDKIIQKIMEHIYPTPPEEQFPSRTGINTGWSFRFSEDEKTTLLCWLLILVAVLLVIGTLIAVFANK